MLYNTIKEKLMPLKKIVVVILILFCVHLAFAGEIKKIDLKNLDGNWEGVGFFLLPVMDTEVKIEGSAKFTYEENKKRLRTELLGEKLFFTYSDSGYLQIDSITDSVSWEIWDNSGKHALYHGIAEGNKLKGDRYHKDKLYEVSIEQITNDSIDFRLKITKPDGNSYDKAVFNLWRSVE